MKILPACTGSKFGQKYWLNLEDDSISTET